MRAIDLYSGIGGWSLGLTLSGIDVVESYEWWKPAAETHERNLGLSTNIVDIRELPLTDLPENIDVVVGSPPCTQFSFANRGGSGDIQDGLKDIVKFLEVVEFLKPKFWAMENIPRVATIIERELQEDGSLIRFEKLFKNASIDIYDISEYGLPQRRKRCIVGNFNRDILVRYKSNLDTVSLGDVISSLARKRINDINYDISLLSNNVSGLNNEIDLSDEETRINKSAKTYHPLYNDMPFPDELKIPSRTITATCTRVSRESVIVKSESKVGFRRLNIRERSTIQGFPINYEFFGGSYSGNLKMIGNAIPPTFTYLIAESMKATSVEDLESTKNKSFLWSNNSITPDYKIDTVGYKYTANRSFKFAIPGLRFKSGTRFELNNSSGKGLWKIEFYYGDSKNIKTIPLNDELLLFIKSNIEQNLLDWIENILSLFNETISSIDHQKMQDTWCRKITTHHPFEVLDLIGNTIQNILKRGNDFEVEVFEELIDKILNQFVIVNPNLGKNKLMNNVRNVILGLLMGIHFNLLGNNN